MAQLNKHYDPHQIENKWYEHWCNCGLFHGDATKGGDPYSIVIPPPNVTGILHMGHALNTTIQDILIRWKRMQGLNTLWVPGTDHAGIATQNVVERKLHKDGSSRTDLGRDKFISKVWEWREEYGETITKQLRKLGASCDWERERFTMDEGLSAAVEKVFVHLYNKQLIYRGNYIINWCPRCQTALSDEESEHQDMSGKLYYIRYPLKGGKRKDGVVVATTRPETLLGDVAVAINPRDARYRDLVGQSLLLPILNRELQIIEDDFVDPEFGTGVVKVTPAHDPNDFAMAQRHDLKPVNVMNDDGTMNEGAGPYSGMDRFVCRKQLLLDLEDAGLIESIEDHQNSVGHCYRCHTMVEPRLSLQWFVKMKPLARPAIEAVKEGNVKFYPERWTKVYLEWMDNIRDWCISRQIWWGHRIPVFYCNSCQHEWAEVGSQEQCPNCSTTDIRQDEDVLDTWFSSWLWPFSVFGWPEKNKDLSFYYPTSSLSTASEIIFFWVARMIMAGFEFMGDIPFSDVYIHGTVRDNSGRKMSKSLGNSIDPLSIIEEYSADALRFSLIMLTATGQDVYISNEKFEIGRNFGTKLWNASRFLQLQSEEPPTDFNNPNFNMELLSADDRHILAKLHQTIAAATENLERYRFNDVAHSIYDFLWHQYCDWYVEYSKQVLYGKDEERRNVVIKVMHYVLSNALKLLHPLMPFITEELWSELGYTQVSESIMTAQWPTPLEEHDLAEWGIDDEVVEYVDNKHDLIRVARTLMADYGLLPNKQVSFILRPTNSDLAEKLEADVSSITDLLRAKQVTICPQYNPDKPVPSGLSAIGTIYMPIEGLVDIEAETAKLDTQLDKVSANLTTVNKKLDNLDFVSKAPQAVVEREQKRKKELIVKKEKLQKLRAALNPA